ncbi:hemolysin D [Jannaschia pagri]|uniref:Hemolysin D n=1 Tax=Jannaschia pagri TaxID=2829797 RepID=A0ABQ4NR29_9RHOB|nr:MULTISPECIES: efflux RND transporter periplasmic adaptor subunit [unclassified Jannaschia]GIT93015.1 hemolysin D [Jannaschia sp. AI_61]GIT96850.1 hemolysin D [Jannaschia sp. AI_62]
MRIVLSSLLLALSASPIASQDLLPSGDPAPLRSVRLVEPLGAAETRDRVFFGRIAARETARLSFEIGGRMVALDVAEGARLSQGDVIARLDPEPLERAVERAELTLAQATRDADRLAVLAERNVAADVRAEDARTARDLADVALRDARKALADATLYAPFDGLVAERLAAVFTNVEQGQPIAALHDLSEIRVEIDLPERVLLRAGGVEALTFTGTLPDGSDVPLTLRDFEAQTGQVGQSFRLALQVPQDRAAGLLPGATMEVTARMPVREAGQILPASAILGRSDRGFEVMIFAPEGDGTGVARAAQVQVSSPDGVTLAVAGLPEDARIIAAGGHLLEEGERVRAYDGLVVEER